MKLATLFLGPLLFAGLLLALGSGCPPFLEQSSLVMAKGVFDGCQGCGPRAGTEKTIVLPGDVLLVLVWIPAGSFMMGRYEGELDSSASEDPQREVTIASGFWMGKYPVTQVQWLAVRSVWPGNAPSEAFGLGLSHPAYNVSWDDAHHFIASLNAHIGATGQGPLTVRLPSEAEWEYACRAGTQTRFYWGDDPNYSAIEHYAWYNGNNMPSGTKAVGQKLPNTFGLYDMSGNVREWCEDDSHANYDGAPSLGTAWIDAPRSINRIIRGGSSGTEGGNCRSASRVGNLHSNRTSFVGFRIAAD